MTKLGKKQKKVSKENSGCIIFLTLSQQQAPPPQQQAPPPQPRMNHIDQVVHLIQTSLEHQQVFKQLMMQICQLEQYKVTFNIFFIIFTLSKYYFVI